MQAVYLSKNQEIKDRSKGRQYLAHREGWLSATVLERAFVDLVAVEAQGKFGRARGLM
jgi:hypothetical protein